MTADYGVFEIDDSRGAAFRAEIATLIATS
jgi:hypothetical protein